MLAIYNLLTEKDDFAMGKNWLDAYQARRGDLARTALVLVLSALPTCALSQGPAGGSCQPPPHIDLTILKEISIMSHPEELKMMERASSPWREEFLDKLPMRDGIPFIEMTTKIKNGQVRMINVSKRSEALITANGDLYTFFHDADLGLPLYFKQTAGELKRQREMMAQMEGALKPGFGVKKGGAHRRPFKLVKSDLSRVIAGYPAVQYLEVSEDNQENIETWRSIEIQDVNLVKRALDCANRRQVALYGLDVEEEEDPLPGLVLERTETSGGRVIAWYRVVSISRDPIPDEEFQPERIGRPVQEAMIERANRGGGGALPAFPGMPSIPGIPVER